MPRIEWTEKFSVGNGDIDNQHQKWIEIHNELHDTLLQGKREDVKMATIKTLEAMKAYVKKHFSFEENYMQTIEYSEIASHIRIHRSFEGQIADYLNQIKQGELILNTEIIKVLKDWLVLHILNEDMKFSELSA